KIKFWNDYLDSAYAYIWLPKDQLQDYIAQREKENEKSLNEYIHESEERLESKNTVNTGSNGKSDNRDIAYRRLAIAHAIISLKSESGEELAKAVEMIDRIKKKEGIPENIYWINYIHALKELDLARNGRDETKRQESRSRFEKNINEIWLNVIYNLEEDSAIVRTSDSKSSICTDTYESFYSVLPQLYRNIADLIVDKAIIDVKMPVSDYLGSVVSALQYREFCETKDENQFFTDMIKNISYNVGAPDSDNFRLKFTVANYRAKELFADVENFIDTKPENAELPFSLSRNYQELAYKWAESRRGKAVATYRFLNSANLIIDRLDGLPESFHTVPGHDGAITMDMAIGLYQELADAKKEELVGWEIYDDKMYYAVMRNLWRSIMDFVIVSSNYYTSNLNVQDRREFIKRSAPAEAALLKYLELFERYTSKGYSEIIPDNAYFGAAEAAGILADVQYWSQSFSDDMSLYNSSFRHYLQSIEIFPFDERLMGNIIRKLKKDSRLELFYNYLLPLSERLYNSQSIKSFRYEKEDGWEDIAALEKDVFESLAKMKSPDNELETQTLEKIRKILSREKDHPIHKLLRKLYYENGRKDLNYLAVKEKLDKSQNETVKIQEMPARTKEKIAPSQTGKDSKAESGIPPPEPAKIHEEKTVASIPVQEIVKSETPQPETVKAPETKNVEKEKKSSRSSSPFELRGITIKDEGEKIRVDLDFDPVKGGGDVSYETAIEHRDGKEWMKLTLTPVLKGTRNPVMNIRSKLTGKILIEKDTTEKYSLNIMVEIPPGMSGVKDLLVVGAQNP
ncbi:MAG: hypothetical protein HY754_12475, partial [Nitrospirae bacterium]|nr:hypothetical protein [Nitrospirota bacterium]